MRDHLGGATRHWDAVAIGVCEVDLCGIRNPVAIGVCEVDLCGIRNPVAVGVGQVRPGGISNPVTVGIGVDIVRYAVAIGVPHRLVASEPSLAQRVQLGGQVVRLVPHSPAVPKPYISVLAVVIGVGVFQVLGVATALVVAGVHHQLAPSGGEALVLSTPTEK